LEFSAISYRFYKLAACPHEITKKFTLGSSVTCTETPRTEKEITNTPLPALDGDRRLCPRRSRRRWGFGWGRTGATWSTGAIGHDGGWCARQATAEQGRRRWRRPWRCIIIPGEGSVNMGGQGAQEHHWSMGILLQYSIGPEMGQREVFDGGAARVLTGGDGDPTFCRLGCRRVVGK
jgi:hypothetical protein